jgi:hypothetical protein
LSPQTFPRRTLSQGSIFPAQNIVSAIFTSKSDFADKTEHNQGQKTDLTQAPRQHKEKDQS